MNTLLYGGQWEADSLAKQNNGGAIVHVHSVCRWRPVGIDLYKLQTRHGPEEHARKEHKPRQARREEPLDTSPTNGKGKKSDGSRK